MKKNYVQPACSILEMDCCEVLATSVLPGDGGPATGILPGEDEFEGEFNSNHEQNFEIWD